MPYMYAVKNEAGFWDVFHDTSDLVVPNAEEHYAVTRMNNPINCCSPRPLGGWSPSASR
jgi:hypothetical protein